MPTLVTLYHKNFGPSEMTSVDADHALTFPDEWSAQPWGDQKPTAIARRDQGASVQAALKVDGGVDGIAAGLPSSTAPIPPSFVVPVPTEQQKSGYGEAATGDLTDDGHRLRQTSMTQMAVDPALGQTGAEQGHNPEQATGSNTSTEATAANAAGTGTTESDEAFGEYRVAHRGRGTYAVLKGDEVVSQGLSKVEAEDQAARLSGSAS